MDCVGMLTLIMSTSKSRLTRSSSFKNFFFHILLYILSCGTCRVFCTLPYTTKNFDILWNRAIHSNLNFSLSLCIYIFFFNSKRSPDSTKYMHKIGCIQQRPKVIVVWLGKKGVFNYKNLTTRL